MRRTKADMLVTREQILSAAFECFFRYGFDKASLEMIAKNAGITRGAVYWHFSDKETLYRKVVDFVLEQGDVSTFSERIAEPLSFEDRLLFVFWTALDNNKYVDFVFLTMNYVSVNRKVFPDLWRDLTENKLRLVRYLDHEVREYAQERGLTENVEKYSAALFLLFEGLFLTKNISEDFSPTREYVREHIHLVLSGLLSA